MAQSDPHRRLTAQDAAFLYIEKPHLPMHGVGIAVYEGKMSLDEVIEATESRLHLVPRYRQKLVFPPFNISHPTWEDDPDFDIRNHIDEITLPAPGDDRILAQAAADKLVPPLDRNRPLWFTRVVHGRSDGNTVVLAGAHHCMVDGVSGVDLSLVMNDLRPDAPPPEPPATPWQPRPLPDPLTLFQDAVRDSLIESASNWTDEQFRPLRPAAEAERQRRLNAGLAGSQQYMQQPAPLTPFNGPVSSRRSGAWVEVEFQQVRAIRQALGGTVNDVVLAIDAGGLRRYMQMRGFPVSGVELRAMCPVSMRGTEGHNQLGNQVSMMLAPLFVGVSDPVERLNRTRERMEQLKRDGQASAFYMMSDLNRGTPAWQQMWASQGDPPVNPLYNTVSTNVPGPQIPLYMHGHQLLHSWGFGMLSSGIGLFIGIGTYWKYLSWGLTADPFMVPDVWAVADCFRESFEELYAAAQKAGAPAPAPVPEPRRRATPAGASGSRR